MLYWCPRAVCYFELSVILGAIVARGVFYMSSSGWLLRIPAWILVAVAVLPIAPALPGLSEAASGTRDILAVIDHARSANDRLLVFVPTVNRELGYELQNQRILNPSSELFLPPLFNHPLSRDEASVLYAVDLGERNEDLARRYPERSPQILRALMTELDDGSWEGEWVLQRMRASPVPPKARAPLPQGVLNPR